MMLRRKNAFFKGQKLKTPKMAEPNEKKIIEILDDYKQSKVIDKHSQKAVLLSRNEEFLNQLGGIQKRLGKQFFKVKNLPENVLRQPSKSNPLIKMGFPDDAETLRLLG